MNSDCEKIRDQIADLISGILSESQVRALEQHIDECSACRDYARALKQEDGLLTEFFSKIETNMTERQEHVLKAINRSGVSEQSDKLSIGRTIMKSRIIKSAAAAVIIIAVLVGIKQFGGSIEAVALGQVIEAMKKVNWMHVVGREKEGGSREAWLSFESKINIRKDKNGRIIYTNYHENKRYIYDPAKHKQTIYVYDVSGSYSENFALGTANPLQLFEELFRMERDDKGAKITRRKAGKAEIWEWEVVTEGNMTEELRVFIDIEKGLPMAMQVKITCNGKILEDTDIRFEYPQNGPEDIYELGAPKSAVVVDGKPSEAKCNIK